MALHVLYFEDRHGNICLPPNSETPTPRGYERREANTLPELDRLQKRMEAAEMRRCQSELEHDETVFAARRRAVYDSLQQKLQSSATSEYEKDFIREYLKLRYEKRAKYQRRFLCDRAFFEAREFDKPRDAEEILGETIGPGDSTVVEGRDDG